MISNRQREMVETIPRFVSGKRKGIPRNDRLKDINRMLGAYSFSDSDLNLFQKEIEGFYARVREKLAKRKKRREEIKKLYQK